MQSQLDVSVLSFGTIFADESVGDALWEEIEFAGTAEALGYKRYWIAEHRTGGLWGGSAMMLAALGGMTTHIRIGSAGALLKHENPFKVAEDSRLLARLFPDRVDLGVCAGTAPPDVARALRGDGPLDPVLPYDEKVRVLAAYARGTTEPTPAPAEGPTPAIWIMAGSGRSVELAGETGGKLSVTLFHRSASPPTPQVIDRYAQAFRESIGAPAPEWNVAVAGSCTEREADAANLRVNQPYAWIEPKVFGTPTQCRSILEETAHAYGTREIVFFDVSPSRSQRRRSCELLAEACGLDRTINRCTP